MRWNAAAGSLRPERRRSKRAADPSAPPRTPDKRYIVVRGRLWRAANPGLFEAERARLVAELMAARRAVRDAGGVTDAVKQARARVDAAKRALGERGEPWWDDGAPDWNRHLAKNTPYADWFAEIAEIAE